MSTPAKTGPMAAWAVAQRSIDMVWKAIVYGLALAAGLCEAPDAVAALGPLAVKLAQAATARPDLFLTGFVEALRPLQGCVPAEDIADLPDGAVLLAAGSFAQIYACEGAPPSSASSLCEASTAEATLKDFTRYGDRPWTDDDDDQHIDAEADRDAGSGVFSLRQRPCRRCPSLVVKVRRPNAVASVAVDHAVLVWFLRTRLGRALVGRACRRALGADAVDHLVAVVGDNLVGHTDFAVEAANSDRMRTAFADDPTGTVIVPRVLGPLCTADRLFMEHVDGVPIARLSTAAARSAAARLLVRAVCRMVFEHGLLHGDIHEGNLLCMRDPAPDTSDACVRVALLDMGVVYEIDPVQRRMIVLLVRTAIGADAPDLLATHIYFAATGADDVGPYGPFRDGVAAAVAAGRHGSDLGAFLDSLAVACGDSGVSMDRDMIARIAPLAAADAIARTYMAPSLTVTACNLYADLFSW